MMSGQHGAAQVVEPAVAALAAVALRMGLGVVAPVPGDVSVGALRAADAVRPAVLAYQGVALGVINQRREIHEQRRGIHGTRIEGWSSVNPAPCRSSPTMLSGHHPGSRQERQIFG